MKKRNLARLAILSATVLWGSGFVAVKDSVASVPPVTLIALRFAFAALLLSLLFIKRLAAVDKGCIWRGAVIGFFLFAAYVAQTVGITDTTPGKNAFLTAVYVVIVPFMCWITEKRRPDRYNMIAAFMCLAGIGLVSLRGDFSVGKGDLLTIACGFLFACHIAAVARLAKRQDPVVITIIQFFFAALFSFAAAALTEDIAAPVPAGAWPGVIYLTVFCTAAALLLQNVGQKYLEPSSASVIMSLEAVFGVAFSLLFGYETPEARIYIGFAVIFAALMISETKLAFLRRKQGQACRGTGADRDK